jgi:hypothetical protein
MQELKKVRRGVCHKAAAQSNREIVRRPVLAVRCFCFVPKPATLILSLPVMKRKQWITDGGQRTIFL